jgi:hypothetical protein
MYKSWNIDQYVKCNTIIAGIRQKRSRNFSHYGVYSIVQPHSRSTPARTPARARPPRHPLNLNSRRTCRSIRRPTTYSPVPYSAATVRAAASKGQGQSQIRLPTSTTPPRPQPWRHIASQFNLQPFRRDHPPLRVVVPSSPPFSSAQAPDSVLQLRRLTPPFSVRLRWPPRLQGKIIDPTDSRSELALGHWLHRRQDPACRCVSALTVDVAARNP